MMLMEVEQEPVGIYNGLAVFHSDLLNEVYYHDSIPYPELDSLFLKQQQIALDISLSRKKYSDRRQEFLTAIQAEGINRNTDQFEQYLALINDGKVLHDAMVEKKSAFNSTNEQYTSLCKTHRIERIQASAYGDTLDRYVFMMGDSLEAMGRSLMASKKHLNQHFGESKTPDFWTAYNKISSMESRLKAFQGSILQLENSQARFYSANIEDYYYVGPFIRQRSDVAATNDLLVSMVIQLQEFRELERSYYQSKFPE